MIEIMPLAAWIAAGEIANTNPDNLPAGNFWEADGACWQYEQDADCARGYRMKAMNVKAFAKADGPDSPMTDFPMVIGGIGLGKLFRQPRGKAFTPCSRGHRISIGTHSSNPYVP